MKNSEKQMTIEEEILLLTQKSKEAPLSIKEILDILSEKGPLLMIIFLSIPFCQPLQIPGVSTLFGIAICFLSLEMIFGKYTCFPKKFLAKKIKPDNLKKITDNTLWVMGKMKRFVYPRLSWVCDRPVLKIVNAVLLFTMGLLLALPLPIPLSNFVCGWAILFIALGLLKDDGLLVIVGYILSFIALMFFMALIFFTKFLFNYSFF